MGVRVAETMNTGGSAPEDMVGLLIEADLALLREALYSGRVTSRGPHLARIAGLAAALVLLSSAAALAGACGDGSASTPPPPDGGDDGGQVATSDCPTIEPRNGAECLLPQGTTCDFGQCGTRLAECTRGAWRVGSNTPPRPPCPVLPPNPDTPCPACWPAEISCTYGSSDCSLADASPNTAIASCPKGASGNWVFDIRPCRDGGGPDVQGDAPDAD